MVPVPSNSLGSFFDGDCYVILAVSGEWAGEGAQQRAKLRAATGGTVKLGEMGTPVQLHPKIAFSGSPQPSHSTRESEI